MDDPRARFEDLVEFPSVFVFRVLAHASEDLPERCAAAVLADVHREVEAIEVKPSGKGNYVAVRVGVTVASADEIRSLYTALHAVSGVRMVL
jgi:putative lipoic acid-binding regulatory protein